MSMIEYQIKQLKRAKHIIKAKLSPLDKIEIDQAIDDAISTIQDLSAKLAAANMERSSAYYNGGWIPVEDHLPENSNDVIVSFKDSNSICIAFYERDKKKWYIHASCAYFGEVIAWMPLPEPYRKDV